MHQPNLTVFAATHLGLCRGQNEDYHGYWVPEAPAERERRGVLLVVADGMGGARSGQVASRLAVDTVLASYKEASNEDLLGNLRQAVVDANRVVHGRSMTDDALSGMGTTCTAAVVHASGILLAHVGDTRAYLVRHGSLRQLTRDHSLVAQMMEDQELTPEQARTDPRRNVVTRSVGVSADIDVDVQRIDSPLAIGDTLLLCSDGLHSQLSGDELARAASRPQLGEACSALIAAANERGGPDNITVVLARIKDTICALAPESASHRDRAPAHRASQHSRRTMLLWLVIVLAVLLLTVGGIIWMLARLASETQVLDRAADRLAALEATWA